jgi:aryl-alcohol dehydrogenase-like predicted oxidoreductase
MGVTPAQLALAWVLHQAPHIVAIPGTTREAHMRDNLAAADVRLDASQLQALDDLINARTVHGERYDAQATVEVDTES